MAKQDVQMRFGLQDGVTAKLKGITSEMTSLSGAVSKLSVAGAALGTVISGFGAFKLFQNAIEQGVKFEDAMKRAQAATHATEAELESLEDAAREAAKETGLGAAEVAEAMALLGKEGANASEAISQVGPALALAQANSLSTADAVSLLAGTMDQFAIGANDAQRAADVLQATAQSGGASVQQMAQAFTAAGPVARQAGIEFEEVAAAAALLAKNGVEGGKAGAQLKAVFQELADPSSKFSAALKAMGVDTSSLGSIIEGLAKRGEAGQAALQLLGDRGASAMRFLLANGGGDLEKLTGLLQQSEGAASRTAAVINDRLGHAFTNFKNAFDDALARLAGPSLEPLKRGFNELADMIREFAESPQFDSLATSIGAFVDRSVEEILRFAREFDFEDALNKAEQFGRDLEASFDTISNVVGGAASAILAAVNGISAAVNGFQVTVNTFRLGILKLEILDAKIKTILHPDARPFIEAMEAAARALEDDLGRSIDATKGAVDGFSGAIEDITLRLEQHRQRTGAAVEPHRQLREEVEKGSVSATKAAGAYKQLGDAAKESASDAAEAADAQLGPGARMLELQDQITQALRDKIAISDELRAAFAKAEAEFVASQAAAQQAMAGVQTSAEGAKQPIQAAAQSAGELRQNFEATGEAAQQTGEQVKEGAQEMTSASAAIASLLQHLVQHFANTSEAAAQLFIEFERSAVRSQRSIGGVIQAILRAADATQEAIDVQRSQAAGLEASLDALGQGGAAAARLIGTSFERLSEESLRDFAIAVREGRTGLNILDQSTLDRLGASAERAADKVRQIREEAQAATEALLNMNDSLQDEIDRTAGNEEAIARRKFEQRLREIEQLAQRGGDLALQQAQAARARAQQILDQELAAIAQRREAERRANEESRRERERNAEIESEAGPATSGAGGQTTSSSGRSGAGPVGPSNVTNHFTITINRGRGRPTDAELDEEAREVMTRIRRIEGRRR